jgi:hypothetical protein
MFATIEIESTLSTQLGGWPPESFPRIFPPRIFPFGKGLQKTASWMIRAFSRKTNSSCPLDLGPHNSETLPWPLKTGSKYAIIPRARDEAKLELEQELFG